MARIRVKTINEPTPDKRNIKEAVAEATKFSMQDIRQRMWQMCDDMQVMLRSGALPKTFVRTQADMYNQLVRMEKEVTEVEYKKLEIEEVKMFIREVIIAIEENVEAQSTKRDIIEQIRERCNTRLSEIISSSVRD